MDSEACCATEFSIIEEELGAMELGSKSTPVEVARDGA